MSSTPDERNLTRDISLNTWQILEMLCQKYGGRVDLAKAYFKALTSSVNKHFDGNGVIASMEHCNDFMFLGTEAISLGRVGKFLPQTVMDSCSLSSTTLIFI